MYSIILLLLMEISFLILENESNKNTEYNLHEYNNNLISNTNLNDF